MNKNIYIIGIGGIGVSAIARYYLSEGTKVYGDDATHSELTNALEKEGVIFCRLEKALEHDIHIVIYTEAVPSDNPELLLAKENNIPTLSYPQALAQIANDKKLITVAGTHGKSTTTSLCSLVLKNSQENFTAVVGTLLKEFDNKNFFHRNSGNSQDHFFVIEACEYKRSFLNYTPTLGIITNIEADHLDYFSDEKDYLDAFISYTHNIKKGGFLIINGDDPNCQKLIGIRDDIEFVEVFDEYFSFNHKMFHFPKISMQVAGNHILFDAKVAYILGHMLGIADTNIISSLESYTGVWRRMEIIGKTTNNNILMSDYGHHPTEIKLTLGALKQKYPDKKLYVVFQPHQYNRTLELLSDFKTSFGDADTLIIPNIYESRDSKADKQNMPVEKFIDSIQHSNIFHGNGLENTQKAIQSYDSENPNSSILLLLGAGNIDTLRYVIETH